MQGYELAIHTLMEELRVIEQYVSSGGRLEDQDVQDLRQCLSMLAAVVTKAEEVGKADWDTDDEQLPTWLQPKPDDKEAETQVAKKA